ADDARRRRAISERLMCELAVDLDEVDGEVGAAANGFAAELEALAPMRRDGLVEITGRRVRITEYGRPLMRAVCAVFDRYLSAGEARHSQAV
ncbi:MAG: coproporphyrinogen III oxidase, partial [Kiloniellales bacterium]